MLTDQGKPADPSLKQIINSPTSVGAVNKHVLLKKLR